jgi:hypothetical protein
MMQSVQVIIERLKSHPEDFFGDMEDRLVVRHAPKFNDIREKLDNLLTDPQDGSVYRLWYLNEDEKLALLEAYKEARRERFEAKVFHTLLTTPEPQETSTATYRQHPVTGKGMMQGAAITSRSLTKQITGLSKDEFDKEYAKISNPRP